MGPSENLHTDLSEPELSESDLLLRQEFVRLYMTKRNAYDACLKLGFLPSYAKDWSKNFMQDGYVRRLIAKAEQERNPDGRYTPRQLELIAQLDREANYFGVGCAHGSRVTAILGLMKLEGMDQQVEEAGKGPRGGVMVVPQLTDANTWGEVALSSQLLLKETVRE